MRIQINENEVYEINIEEVLNPIEFLEVYEKFGKIYKLIKISNQETDFVNFKSEFNSRFPKPKQRKKYILRNPTQRGNANPWFDTREKALDILQYHYHGSKIDKDRIVKLMNRPWVDTCKSFAALMVRYEIKPWELGMLQKGDKVSFKVNILDQNYVIKSHTGIFDEKSNGNTNK